METRLFDRDPVTGTTKLFHYDHTNDSFIIETQYQADALLEHNKALANEASGWKGDLRRVASIPMNLYFELKAKGIIDDPAALRQWLNDSENRFFRTQLGKV